LIVEQEISSSQVAVVREAPFSTAMRKSFQIGIESGLPWTYCIDADVLLRPGSIAQMLAIAEQQDSMVCEIQGYVLCKFFGGPRPAGNHLYRTELLEQALACIPSEGVDIRPEFHTLNTMQAKGFPWLTVPYLVGLHDFEQFYRDIFRKCFVQAHKHEYLTELFMSVWREGPKTDEDFRVAIAGYSKGIAHHGQVAIDVRQEHFQVNLSALGLAEKPELNPAEWTLAGIESQLANWVEPEIYLKWFPGRHGLDIQEPRQLSLLEKCGQRYAQLGILRFIPFVLGSGLVKIGAAIQKRVNKA
jgi:hypothetical protein